MDSRSADFCVLCLGNRLEVVMPKPPRSMFHCRSCDLIFAFPEARPDSVAERDRYLWHQNSIDDAGYVAMFDDVIASIQGRVEPGSHILDYGCGPSQVLVELLRRRGFDVTGFDPIFAPDANLSHIFDAIVSVETFEHFFEPKLEIERIASLLRGGGCLIVKSQFHRGEESMHDWWYARDITHVSFYSKKTFEYIAEMFGFEILASDEKALAVLRKRL